MRNLKTKITFQVLNIFRDFFLYLLLAIGCILMARNILQYRFFDPGVGFLAFKQEYLSIKIWNWAFYIHVFSSLFTLLSGFFQFSKFLQSRHRKIHRWIGRIYVYNILFINFPAGLIMAIYANGLWPSKLAFLILDSLWFYFTLRALLEIKRKNIKAHREFMIRSFALTCSAVTLRSWKIVLTSLFTLDPLHLYMINAWMGFVPNLIVAEWIIRKNKKING